MPTYDYRCQSCGKFTVSQGIKEPALSSCPTCGSPVSRLIGKNVNILYKCAGFYCTDNKAASGTAGSHPSSEASASSDNTGKAVNE